MLTYPPEIITSNLGKWIELFGITNLPIWIHTQYTDFQKATLYTDDFKGYKPFKKIVSHAVINHSRREYARNGIHTNTIEGFGGLFKRAIIGNYHKLSTKHLDKYIQECCFKYNNRNNANIFDMLLVNCVR